MCVCACVRACVRACVCVRVHVCVCVCTRVRSYMRVSILGACVEQASVRICTCVFRARACKCA